MRHAHARPQLWTFIICSYAYVVCTVASSRLANATGDNILLYGKVSSLKLGHYE